jgi:titin
LKPKDVRSGQTDWQKSVKSKKSQEYYSKLQDLETDQLLKEQRNREQTHQFAIPGETVGNSTSLAKGMASQYENQL